MSGKVTISAPNGPVPSGGTVCVTVTVTPTTATPDVDVSTGNGWSRITDLIPISPGEYLACFCVPPGTQVVRVHASTPSSQTTTTTILTS